MQKLFVLPFLAMLFNASTPEAATPYPNLEKLNAICVERLNQANAPDVREACANAAYEAARVAPISAEHATALNNLALLYERRGKVKEAERLYRMSLYYFEQALGANHPNLAQSLDNLAGF